MYGTKTLHVQHSKNDTKTNIQITMINTTHPPYIHQNHPFP